jgi:hypothetical protein
MCYSIVHIDSHASFEIWLIKFCFLSTWLSPDVYKGNPSALLGLACVPRCPTLAYHMTKSCLLYGSYWSAP